ncbi:MAG: exopolyphosphatase [Desulfobacteraceae bacterium]|jgi:exopolyphosphatase/guanosine-5'-triphosphate,3'-diphosphate pyrophosphatase
METGHKYAAIDIGSNAVRLLLSAVFETDEGPYFRKISLIRMPIRLGDDAFIQHCISDPKIGQLVQAMTGFKHLIEAYQPIAYRACATSAMREAQNGLQICRRIREEAGIEVQIIDGKEEAGIIFANSTPKRADDKAVEVYLDVGGGSTEITIFNDNQQVSRSFNIGTIRLMQDMVTSADWEMMKQWVKEKTEPFHHLVAVCSGGNIHKIKRLSKSKDGETISFKHMKKVRKLLKAYTVAERVTKLGLKPDRADVILPAHKIYYSVLKWGRIPLIKVPQMGLADGIVRQLYFQENPEPD